METLQFTNGKNISFDAPVPVIPKFKCGGYWNGYLMDRYDLSNPFEDIVGVDDETKNIVVFKDGKVMSRSISDGRALNNYRVMPDIKDVQTIEDEDYNVKVVTVLFADNTSEKAVLHKEDVYSLEQGISICIAKKLLSMETDGHGSSVYNKIIRHAVKVMNENRKEEQEIAHTTETIRRKIAKAAQKKAKQKAKREAAKREEAIAIQAEAYLRAMREYNNAPSVE